MKRMNCILCSSLFLLLITLVGCGGGDDPTSPGGGNNPSLTGTLVYEYGDPSQVYMIKDGQTSRVNPGNNYRESYPVISPDGTKVAFASGTDGVIYIKDIGGGQARVLPSGYCTYIDWSPDGNRLVYRGSSSPGGEGIYIIGADGTGKRKLSDNYGWPAWSADGTQVFYGLDNNIYSISLSGSNEHIVRSFASEERVFGIDASPTGSYLTFYLMGGLPDRLEKIYTMSLDGSNLHLTLGDGVPSSAFPCCSPDGEMIAFSRAGDIYVCSRYGDDVHKVTDTPGDVYCQRPSWGP